MICTSELLEGYKHSSQFTSKSTYWKNTNRSLNTTENDLTLENIQPQIQKASDFEIISFDKTAKDAERVKTHFSKLKLRTYLNKEEQIRIENISAKYSDTFICATRKLQ